eukprot:6280422-Pyramimonas_sp.AAC.1
MLHRALPPSARAASLGARRAAGVSLSCLARLAQCVSGVNSVGQPRPPQHMLVRPSKTLSFPT